MSGASSKPLPPRSSWAAIVTVASVALVLLAGGGWVTRGALGERADARAVARDGVTVRATVISTILSGTRNTRPASARIRFDDGDEVDVPIEAAVNTGARIEVKRSVSRPGAARVVGYEGEMWGWYLFVSLIPLGLGAACLVGVFREVRVALSRS